jgi:EAL domain-containing protein (putative c-di-GMP-specific phosphodiesterase class I)
MRSDAIVRATVAGVVQASRVLGLRTVAKHGDLELEAEWLKSVGVDFLQSHTATKLRLLHSFNSRPRSAV